MRLSCLLMLACVTTRVARKEGVQSFIVEPVDAALGTKAAPLPFATFEEPFVMSMRIRAVGFDGAPVKFSGRLLLDARPAIVTPSEVEMQGGEATVEIAVARAYGDVTVWVEDCGTREPPAKPDCTAEELQAYKPECFQRFKAGTLATGITPPIHFANPRLDHIQETIDSGTSALVSSNGDRCATLADPRYVDTTNLSQTLLQGVKRSQRLPTTASSLSITAGNLIVNAIDGSGFYVSDTEDSARIKGFNHIYVFNFGVPIGLSVGDRLTRLDGAPAEFNGSTQLANPFWVRDRNGPFKDQIPKPTYVPVQLLANNMSRTGGNISTMLDMEKLEGGIVCLDNVKIPSGGVNCDINKDGRVDRFMPSGGSNPEATCEQQCYDNDNCFESSGYLAFNQWGAAVFDPGEPPTARAQTVRIGVVMGSASPGFRPDQLTTAFEKKGREAPFFAVTGNLVHVLGGRPVWVVKPRGPDDLSPRLSEVLAKLANDEPIENGKCPPP